MRHNFLICVPYHSRAKLSPVNWCGAPHCIFHAFCIPYLPVYKSTFNSLKSVHKFVVKFASCWLPLKSLHKTQEVKTQGTCDRTWCQTVQALFYLNSKLKKGKKGLRLGDFCFKNVFSVLT